MLSDKELNGSELKKMDENSYWTSSSPNLQKNLHLLAPYEIKLAKMLVEIEQLHLFEYWSDPGVDDEEKRSFFNQVAHLDSTYSGGLTSYVKTARILLADSKAGRNPFEGFTPSVPLGETICFGSSEFVNFEEIGLREAEKAVFVLVAGGLGERLGYSGIKVALPSETTSGTCFLQLFIESIIALQEVEFGGKKGYMKENVFVIMTSDDTHEKTLALLQSNDYFGMKPTHIKLLKQEKVACLSDNTAKLAIDPQNKYRIQTKPHGHGDVHSLLYNSGLLNEWCDAGIRWVLFFQDTNALVFKAIPAALGVSCVRQFHVNSLAVPRKAKEAIGGIAKLTHSDGRTMVINVEYNQLDPLLRASGFPDGDVNCEAGYSLFPGNINQLIFELTPYLQQLTKTGGVIQEFVNPKYADGSKTSFKSSTRLECMMQDYPKTLSSNARVGFTVFDSWYAYAPVKNNPIDAAKVPRGNPYHSATSGELAVYHANCRILEKAGVKIGEAVKSVINGQEVKVWPRVVWRPNWGMTYEEVKRKVVGDCSISQNSTLVIEGANVCIKDLELDGALVVKTVGGGSTVTIGGCVSNKGWVMEIVDSSKEEEGEETRIRGFKFNKVETCVM